MKRILLFAGIIALVFSLSSCIIPVPNIPDTTWDIVYSWSYETLSEHYYMPSSSFYFSYSDEAIKITVDPYDVPSYGFEVWIMTEDQYYDFHNYGSVSVKAHYTVYGSSRELIYYPSEKGCLYRVVIDNTDLGWVNTDFDGVDDYVVFDAKVEVSSNY